MHSLRVKISTNINLHRLFTYPVIVIRNNPAEEIDHDQQNEENADIPLSRIQEFNQIPES